MLFFCLLLGTAIGLQDHFSKIMNSQQLHLHLETQTDSESTNPIDLNDTWDYEDQSLMDTSATATSSSKRTRSDSENSDIEISSKKHNVSGNCRNEEYKNQNVVVFVVSDNVNLGKTNPIFIAKTINDLVGPVQKVMSTQYGIKIICRKSQANILTKEKKFGTYSCKFSIKDVPKPITRGITHGIPLEMNLLEIKQELEEANSMKIEKINRLKKFDKAQQEKIDTESIIIEYSQNIEFPLHMYFGYKRITVKQFIPHPVRCFKCQKYGHISKNCRGTTICPICSNNHTFDNCDNKQNVKCCNCGLKHSAGYKGCEEFIKAKQIKEYSHSNKLSYAEATKQLRTNNVTVLHQNTQDHTKANEKNEKVENQTNEAAIVEKVVEQIQTQTKENEKQIMDQIMEKVQSQTTEYEDEITEKIISKTENRCRCKMPPEGVFVFIIRAIKYFKDENFQKKNSDNQIRLLTHVFEKCTLLTLNHIKIYDILRS